MIATVFPKRELDHELGDAAARMVALRVTAADLDRERPRLLQEVANMFEGFPALAAMNNARELVRPTPRTAGTAASRNRSGRSRSRKSRPA